MQGFLRPAKPFFQTPAKSTSTMTNNTGRWLTFPRQGCCRCCCCSSSSSYFHFCCCRFLFLFLLCVYSVFFGCPESIWEVVEHGLRVHRSGPVANQFSAQTRGLCLCIVWSLLVIVIVVNVPLKLEDIVVAVVGH